MKLIPTGSLCRMLHEVETPAVRILQKGDRVRILGVMYPTDSNPKYHYVVEDMKGTRVIIDIVDIVEIRDISEEVVAAFREGYSRGHSRGLTCGKLYGDDSQFRKALWEGVREYIREVRDE